MHPGVEDAAAVDVAGSEAELGGATSFGKQRFFATTEGCLAVILVS